MKKKSEDKWPSQKKVVPFGFAPKGWFAYEPYKGSPDDETVEKESKPKGISVNDALQHYLSNPGEHGKPTYIDTNTKLVEFEDKTRMDFNELVQAYSDDLQKESSGGRSFFWSPVDIGKDPKGDFPSVKWMPRGHEDLDLDPNYTSAFLNKKAESYADATAWVRTWISEDDIDNDEEAQKILHSDASLEEKEKALTERVRRC